MAGIARAEDFEGDRTSARRVDGGMQSPVIMGSLGAIQLIVSTVWESWDAIYELSSLMTWRPFIHARMLDHDVRSTPSQLSYVHQSK
jgi:hypothetical protein